MVETIHILMIDFSYLADCIVRKKITVNRMKVIEISFGGYSTDDFAMLAWKLVVVVVW